METEFEFGVSRLHFSIYSFSLSCFHFLKSELGDVGICRADTGALANVLLCQDLLRFGLLLGGFYVVAGS